MDANELDENWRRACRSDPLLRRFGEPPESMQFVRAVLSRVNGTGFPPNSILRGHATGFAALRWEVSPEATYAQLAKLVVEAAKGDSADPLEALHTLILVGDAAVGALIEVWRGEAEEDKLTHLGNRRRMEAAARSFVDTESPFEYASIDVDNLKAVNDAGGHAAGDELLKRVSSHLNSSMSDLEVQSFRYGGDEFGILRAKSDGADRLDEALEASIQFLQTGDSFSWGVSSWPDDDKDFSTVINKADRQMYDRKSKKKLAQSEE